jgi:hypothetical protein
MDAELDLARIAPVLRLVAQHDGGLVAAEMIKAFGLRRLSAADHAYLSGPMILHSQGNWYRDTPRWLLSQARAERVDVVLGLEPRWIVGPTEIVAVMMPATQEAPLSTNAVQLYLWACRHALARSGRQVPKEPDSIRMHPATDDEVLDRGGWLHDDYRRLAQEIRRKVEARAPRLRHEKAIAA